jgi:amidohydrolase
METGRLGFRKGMYMASTDELHVTVTGKGGHAAMPEHYKNPLIAAADFLLKVQQRFMNPEVQSDLKASGRPTVLAFGKMEAAGATNVIPEKVTLAGTFRTMNEEWRVEVHEVLQQIAREVTQQHQQKVELRIDLGYPFLVNDTELTQRCHTSASLLLGNENIDELPLRMTAEDFSFISQKVPSCFFRLGTGNKARGIVSGVHTDTFDIDEAALRIGMETLAWLAVSELKVESPR